MDFSIKHYVVDEDDHADSDFATRKVYFSDDVEEIFFDDDYADSEKLAGSDVDAVPLDYNIGTVAEDAGERKDSAKVVGDAIAVIDDAAASLMIAMFIARTHIVERVEDGDSYFDVRAMLGNLGDRGVEVLLKIISVGFFLDKPVVHRELCSHLKESLVTYQKSCPSLHEIAEDIVGWLQE